MSKTHKPGAVTVVGNGTSQLIFDMRPIEMGGFQLRGLEAVPIVGVKITLEGWQQAFNLASAATEAGPYWVGDLLAYAETRDDWKEKFDQAKSQTRLAEQTLHNQTTICRKVKGNARVLSPSMGHSDAVAKFEPKEQEAWLGKARSEGWNVGEFRKEIRASERTKIIEGQATLEGMYRVIYADPPWKYGDTGATKDGSLGKAERHYPGMTIEELCKLPVEAHALPDSVLFMWVTAPMLYENPGPREVIEAWGFKPKTGIVWDKVLGNFGHYTHVTHEHLIIATRGSCMPDAPTPQPKSVQTERRSEAHSEKPEHFRKLIEKLYIYGPFLELFGREKREGWDVFGNDARLWAEEVAQ